MGCLFDSTSVATYTQPALFLNVDMGCFLMSTWEVFAGQLVCDQLLCSFRSLGYILYACGDAARGSFSVATWCENAGAK